MKVQPPRGKTVPIGIDLGTTYSSLTYLTPQGHPVTLPNEEGDLSTPSAVLFDGSDIIVGTEALRHSISSPERVVQHVKRHMGDPHKCWVFNGRVYRPRDLSALILKKMLTAAETQLGTIRHAVITVPAQFSELQRRDTVEAGLQAGLERVDIINEPVAAALCHVLGEGIWYAELANEQTVLVFDLGGGTFDLSLVQYNRQQVRVLASGGDLQLGGLDWNQLLAEHACNQFVQESVSDPRTDPESMQALSLEIEQLKRSLSTRPRSSLVIQHAGRRKTLTVTREQFETLASELVSRTRLLTQEMLKSNRLGWAHVDTVLATGGATRMPMIRNMLQQISGTTLNQTLSPDQSISHGAAYYAGMLLSGQRFSKSNLSRQASGRLSSFKQQSVSGRALGLLVRNMETRQRVPHYLIPVNTPLPCAYQQRFGTAVAGQKKVHLFIIESGTRPDDPFVELGECIVAELPDGLPESSPIDVTFRYDEQARLHVEAVDVASGQSATTTILRPAHIAPADRTTETAPLPADAPVMLPPPSPRPNPGPTSRPAASPEVPLPMAIPARPASSPAPAPRQALQANLSEMPLKEITGEQQIIYPELQTRKAKKVEPAPSISLEASDFPVPLCPACGEVLDAWGKCTACQKKPGSSRPAAPPPPAHDDHTAKTEAMMAYRPPTNRPRKPR